jgi:hypothetical protein
MIYCIIEVVVLFWLIATSTWNVIDLDSLSPPLDYIVSMTQTCLFAFPVSLETTRQGGEGEMV